ncbi:MAG: replication factor A protein 3 [Monoraphidium minutum]|nr:MAG: replication factor A protein 3 [Monoraphidium minutum]
MNADDPTPRVGFAQLKNMIGRRVLFVGRVESMDGGLAQMAAPDGSKVAIQANSVFETPFAEVLGVVVDPQTIREESHVSFGESFDMNTYNEFLKLANGPHQQMFY